jgi:hypothetical protein
MFFDAFEARIQISVHLQLPKRYAGSEDLFSVWLIV